MGWEEALEAASEAAAKLGDPELVRKLAEARAECAKLAAENARLRQEVNELREDLDAVSRMDNRE